MTKDEFLVIREKLVQVVLEYEMLQRKIKFLRDSYFLEFEEILLQRLYLEYENQYMLAAIAKHSEGMSKEDIQVFLDQSKEEFKAVLGEFEQQMTDAKELEKRCKGYTQADLEKLDQDYMQYCALYHPYIKYHTTMNERNAYQTLTMLYRMGNITGFRNLLKEFQPTFTSTDIDEEKLDEIATFYEKKYQELHSIIEEQKGQEPLCREVIFYDENLMTAEYGNLREWVYSQKEMNKEIHKDFSSHFDFDFEL